MYLVKNPVAVRRVLEPAPSPVILRPAIHPEIILDLSRLLSRLLHPAPTGVDRVEMAYARTLHRMIPDRLRFGAVHPSGVYGRIPNAAVQRFLDQTEERWDRCGAKESKKDAWRIALDHAWALRPRPVPRGQTARILLQSSPHHLHQEKVVSGKLARERARFICLVHDLIPISHPEYARPNGSELHTRRIATLAAHANGLLTNSAATLESLLGRAEPRLLDRPVRVARLGIDAGQRPVTPKAWPGNGYFICLGTIEPRKNHLLLLNVWRSLVDALGPHHCPQLLLVGRRGWENENVIDMLERCDQLKGVVHELSRLPDQDVRSLLHGARALLMPSFAEGFGLPITEALTEGVPVIASDLPAHREAGGIVPDYCDPIDGVAWRNAVLDYYAPASQRRRAQCARLSTWQPVTWESHIEAALALAEEVAQC